MCDSLLFSPGRVARAALLAVLIPSGIAGAAAGASPADIGAYVRATMESFGIPGCAFASFDANGVRHSGAFGVADASGGPVTQRTPFVIGSISKAITAYAALALAEQGRLDLDAPANRHLSWLDPKLTVADLMHQTSGYSGRDGVDFDRHSASATLAELVRGYRSLEPRGGSSFEYSNVNYNLLGAIIARITGRRFADHVREAVFDELGMTCSFTDLDRARAAGLSNGHRFFFRRPIPAGGLPFFDSFLPSMTMASCSADLAVFFGAILARSDTTASGYPGVVDPSQQAVVEGYRGSYGYGFLITRFEGERTWFFQGGYRSFRSHAFLFPDRGVGVLGLTNVNTMFSDGALRELVPNLARLELGLPLERPRPDHGYWALLTALVLASVLQLARMGRCLRRRSPGVLPGLTIAVDVGVVVLLIGAVPRLWGIHLNTMFFIQPDLASLTCGVAALSAAMAILRLYLLLVAGASGK
jgi:CubicO group peptidase (beta-lactamase class C family)